MVSLPLGDNVRGVDVGWVEVRIFGRVKQALGLFDSPRPFGNFYRVRREIRCKYEREERRQNLSGGSDILR